MTALSLRKRLLALCLSVMASPLMADDRPAGVPAALFDYVAKPESVYRFEETQARQLPNGGVITDGVLVSQTWQGIVWKHSLQLHEPVKLSHPKHVILFVTGGRVEDPPKPRDTELGARLAQLAGCRVAVISQVPNQPLLGDRVEDDLITESWLKFLETGDENWPLLFPMVKSAVQAMNAIDAIGKERWGGAPEGYVISGASKRGWTSWLAPAVDRRIVATAPIVIDVLNFRPQMAHQLATWGAYSEQIADYTRKGLIKEGAETAREEALRTMMDPFTYREMISIPKLQINGTNDPYWVVDANRFYWNELIGPKYVLQIPNAGHDLKGGQDLALSTLAAFVRHVASGRELPKLEWVSRRDASGKVTRALTCDVRPKLARIWTAESPDKDFRNDRWSPRELALPEENDPSKWEVVVAVPDDGHVSHYCELQFEIDGIPYAICTTIESDGK